MVPADVVVVVLSSDAWARVNVAVSRIAPIALRMMFLIRRKASQTEVTIQCLDGSIHMAITDDGHGFNVEDKSRTKKVQRLGLLACASASK